MRDVIPTTPTAFALTRRLDFKAYNIIDPSNLNPYLDIFLCADGKVYDAAVKLCISNINFKINSSCNY